MEEIARSSPHGHCVFCEDVRFEINSKETYVGVFAGPEMFVLGQLPTNIGKFSIKVYYAQRPTDVIAPIFFEVLLPGDSDDSPTAQIEVDFPAIIKDVPKPPDDMDDPFFSFQTIFSFNPLEIKEEGAIRVRAVRDGKRYRLGGLRVKTRPMEAPPPQEAAN